MLIVHLFVSYAHVNLCHFFSSTWYRGLAAASVCGSSWTFLFTFLLRSLYFAAFCFLIRFVKLYILDILRLNIYIYAN